MQFIRSAARLARLFRMHPPPSTAVDIDLSTLAGSNGEPQAPDPALLAATLHQPPPDEGAVDLRANSPWRTQPGVRYRP